MSLNRPPVCVWTDHSGTIAIANTAQLLMAANNQRIGLLIQNLHATEVMWVKFKSANGTDAQANAAGNVQIAANGGILQIAEYADPGQISIVAVSATHPYTAAEWGT